MRIFVAGASGVIGRQLLPQLAAQGHQVTATTRSPAKTGLLRSLGAEPVVADGLAASATVAARDHGSPGLYTVVDGEPARATEWLPALARAAGSGTARRVPVWLGRLAAGEARVVMMTQVRGCSNAKAKRELDWRPGRPSWRQRFREAPAAEPQQVPA